MCSPESEELRGPLTGFGAPDLAIGAPGEHGLQASEQVPADAGKYGREVPVTFALLAPHAGHILGPERAEAPENRSKEKAKQNRNGAARPGALLRRDCRIDHRDHRGVVDFLDARRLVLAFEREVDLLADLDLPPQATLFENKLGCLLVGSVPLIEGTQLFLCRAEFQLGGGNALLHKLATLPRLRLSLPGIEIVQIVDEAVGYRCSQFRVPRGDIEAHHASLVVDLRGHEALQ